MKGEIIRQYNVLLLDEDLVKITLGVDESFDRDKQESLEFLLGKVIIPVTIDKQLLKDTIAKQYNSEQNITVYKNPEPIATETEFNIETIVSNIINQAIKKGASDIHWERYEGTDLLIRYRIDGQLNKKDCKDEVFSGLKIISHIKIMCHMNIDEKRLPQDGRLPWNYEGKKYDLRVSSLPTVYGENLVIRILDREDLNLDIQSLGLSAGNWYAVENLVKKPYGLVLVTGPTGSGKTTTLYSFLNYRSRFNDKIITIEDPIEYEFNHFSQIPVRAQIGMTFGNALRAILRQSPNTIMIGEIRDKETAQISVNAALTGHLVLSTLHTNDALSAISRLSDLGLEGYQIAGALQGVIAQRLIRKLCTFCKEAYKPSSEELALLDFTYQEGVKGHFYQKKGCPNCSYKGFKGRLGLFEVLTIGDKLRDVMNRTMNPQELIDYSDMEKIKSIKENGKEKILEGLTTIDEVLSTIVS